METLKDTIINIAKVIVCLVLSPIILIAIISFIGYLLYIKHPLKKDFGDKLSIETEEEGEFMPWEEVNTRLKSEYTEFYTVGTCPTCGTNIYKIDFYEFEPCCLFDSFEGSVALCPKCKKQIDINTISAPAHLVYPLHFNLLDNITNKEK